MTFWSFCRGLREKCAGSRVHQNTKCTRSLSLILTLSRSFKLSTAIRFASTESCAFLHISNCHHRSLPTNATKTRRHVIEYESDHN